MNCPSCGVVAARIYRTLIGPDVDRRQRKCRCGVTWNTTERVDAKSIRVEAGDGKVKGEIDEPRTLRHQKRAAELPGSSSLPEISNLSPSKPDPDPNSVDTSKRARVGRKGRPSTVEYSLDFERLWQGMEHKRGNKKPAFEAWVKIDPAISPNVDLVISRWNQWTGTTQWQDGFGPYVATWINDQGWENEPDPVEFRQRGRGKSDGNVDALQGWLAKGTG